MPTVLRKGMKHAEVVRLKQLLNARLKPHPGLSMSEDFGPKTETAVRSFQTQARLPVTGVVDAATWAALEGKTAVVPATAKGPKAPPATVPGKQKVRTLKSTTFDVDIDFEVLPDAKTNEVKVIGKTNFRSEGYLVADGKSALVVTPGYEYQIHGSQKIITKLTGPVQIKGKYVVQTLYGPNASATTVSGYGRGTTPEDEAAGNTSLGFHESCHREDYRSYLATTPLPQFGGRAGMSVEQYQQASKMFLEAMKTFDAEMGKRSKAKTDEVGYEKSKYDQFGPRK